MFKKLIEKLKGKEAKNAGWLIGEQIFQMLLNFVIGIFSARFLGPTNYGSLNYTASFVTFFTSIASLEMNGIVIKKMIEKPEKEGAYLGSAMVFRLVSSVLSSITILLIIHFLKPDEPIKIVLAALQSLQLIAQAVQILDCWFQRYLKAKYVSIGKMIASIIVAAYRIYLLATAKSITWFAFSNSLTTIVISIVLFVFYKTQNGQKLSFDFKLGKEVLGESYHFILSGIMSALYSQMDKIMIGQMLTDTDVGFYTTATSICGMWIFIPNAIINTFRPGIMELKHEGKEDQYIRRLEQLYSGIIWLCIFVSIVVVIIGPFAIKVLFGEVYSGAIGPLRIAIWFETFAMIGTARGIWIISENKNKYVKYYLGIGAIANFILNSLMIPVWGTNGAALATLLTQITTSLIAPLFFKETRIHTKYVLEAFTFKWARSHK